MWSLTVSQKTKARYLREISVKAETDEKDCLISGIAVLSGDRMVVTDYNNNAVKLVDMKKNKVTF